MTRVDALHLEPRPTATLSPVADPDVPLHARERAMPEPLPFPAPPDRRLEGESWAVILAGGEGRRIRSWTTTDGGDHLPKQFCRFRDERTLLAATVARALQLVPAERVIVLVLEEHRRWWEPELTALPPGNVLAQPANRGTAVAILQALVEIHCRDRDPRLVFMPSDAEVDREAVLVRAIRRAMRSASRHTADVVLLGMVPSHLDSEYGLIVPERGRTAASRRVRAFVEKPPLTVAQRLARDGAVWNSFIFACTGWALYDLFEDALPQVADAYLRGLGRAGAHERARAAVVAEMPARDFGSDVLQRCTERLRLVTVPPCGWTDIGTPPRLASWLYGHRDAFFWNRAPVLPHPDDDMGGATQTA